jgi:SAM-dependent MidA family methyltransferase
VNLSDLDATHNAALRDIICDRIRRDGPISFAEFYETALYHPRHGYYFSQDPTLDFQSSPNVHPVFGAAIARQLATLWHDLDRPARFDVFEAGAASGRLAADVLRYLRASDPDAYAATRYVLQDVTLTSEAAATRLEAAGLPLDRIEVAASLPESAQIEGVILSNELLDALPFHRLRRRDGRLYELLVGMEDGALVDAEGDPRPDILAHFEALGVSPGEGCDAEVCLAAPAWVRRAANALRRGYVLTLDYGYEAGSLRPLAQARRCSPSTAIPPATTPTRASAGITASVDFTSASAPASRPGCARPLHRPGRIPRLARHRRSLTQPPQPDQARPHRPA